jgi:uncharacterized damage-inducible protein DinB
MQTTINVTQEDTEHVKPFDQSIVRPFKRFGRPLRTLLLALLICLLALATVAPAQEPPKSSAASNPDNPLLAPNKVVYRFLKDVLLRSAERMPEEHYNFKPTWIVRSFGNLVGHVADAQYSMCAIALGEKDPALRIEKTKTSKADLIAALKDASAYCDRAYASLTDASAAQMVKFQGLDHTKFFVLTANNLHTMEHYGNMVVYLRMKNILPPSSDPEYGQRPRANPATKK